MLGESNTYAQSEYIRHYGHHPTGERGGGTPAGGVGGGSKRLKAPQNLHIEILGFRGTRIAQRLCSNIIDLRV